MELFLCKERYQGALWFRYRLFTVVCVPERSLFIIPLLVFFSCGQIMYSWLLRPDTIPKSYSVWVSTAAKVLQPTVLINRKFAREGRPDPKDMQTLLDWKVRAIIKVLLSSS